MQQQALADFYKTINIEKLRKSNDLGKKWADRFNISKNEYMKFIIAIKKDKSKYFDILENRFKSQFSKDYKSMFYAAEIEGLVIEQFYHTVQHCLNKLQIKDTNREDFHSIGLTSLRSAVWTYRTHKLKASFFTYCFNGIFHRILGVKTKLYKSLNTPNKKIMVLEADYFSASNSRRFGISDMKITNVDFDKNIEDEESQILFKSLLEHTPLKEDEIFLLKNFMSRQDETPDWCRLYREKFPTKEGKMVSRQGVHCKLAIVQRKIFQTLIKLRKARPIALESKFAV